jgi:hypothetical protein
MRAFRTVVVAVILTALLSPAASLAKTEPQAPPVAARQVGETALTLTNAAATAANVAIGEAARYSQREQQSKALQDFKGGAVYVAYVGSGVVLVLLLIILVLIL